MGRIIAIDYGTKRVGIAVTDILQIIATPLKTESRNNIIQFLKEYIKKEPVDKFVIGYPKNTNNTDSEIEIEIKKFIKELKQQFIKIPISREDERFTSKIALKTMIDANTTKKQRRNKATIDKISATIILQSYMEKI